MGNREMQLLRDQVLFAGVWSLWGTGRCNSCATKFFPQECGVCGDQGEATLARPSSFRRSVEFVGNREMQLLRDRLGLRVQGLGLGV